MKKKTTIISEEFDENGKLLCRTTETTEESDNNGYIYPQYTPLFSTTPTWVAPSITPTWYEKQFTCRGDK